MTIKLNSLCITNYDSELIENVKFLEKIKADKDIASNLDDISISLERSNHADSFKLGSAYIVKNSDDIIGLVRLLKKENKDKALNIDLAILKDYRNKGYGIKLLKELGNYILENSSLIEKVKLTGCVDSTDLQQQLVYVKHK